MIQKDEIESKSAEQKRYKKNVEGEYQYETTHLILNVI